MRWFLLPLLFAFAACDPGTATGPSSQAPPVAQASLEVKTESDTPYAIAENILLHTEGDHLVLEVNGEAIALTAGQAYLAGQALSRGGYELMDPELAGLIRPKRPKGGPECHEPPEGTAVIFIGGQLFGGGGCPPPPPPMLRIDLLGDLLGDAAPKIVRAPNPEEITWYDVPGGFMADF